MSSMAPANKGKGFIYPDLNKETPYKVVNFIRK